MQTPEHVLAFWFGGDPAGDPLPTEPIPEDIRERWWRKDPAFDQEIRERFGELHRRACAGELDSWCNTAQGCLALVIVLDQFSRNLFRDDPRAWAADAKALRHCLGAINQGLDRELPPQGRMFLYMPLMHAEDRELQALSVAKFRELEEEDPSLTGNLDYAVRHQEIVDRFGRFPHRNATLGRESTPEEEAFLLQPGSSF